MASFTVDAILTGKEHEELLRPLKEKMRGEKKGEKILTSLNESNDNIDLVERLLDPFLTLLGFDVHYWIKDVKIGLRMMVLDPQAT